MDYFINARTLGDKLASILADKSLLHVLETNRYPITLTIRQNQAPDAQMALYDTSDSTVSSQDSVIQFIFNLDGLKVQTDSRVIIEDAFLSKIKGLAKKIHYAYLQAYFANTVAALPQTDEDPEDEYLEEDNFDGFYEDLEDEPDDEEDYEDDPSEE